MIDGILILIFWISSGLIVYHHLGYPLLLKWYAKTHPQPARTESFRGFKPSLHDKQRPSITILIPAFNEQRWIADKIRNLAALDYPRDRLIIIIACDGCTDETVNIACATIQEAICADTYFEIHDYPTNRGKVALINHEMKSIDSDITVLSDVSALISLDALIIAERHFQNERLGVLNTCYRLLSPANEGENKYWRYQSQIKQNEASMGATLGAHGAFYLFRTHLFEPLPAHTINDDFILPMNIVKQGYHADYDPAMTAVEMEATPLTDDFHRRLRISAGNMQQLIILFGLLNPRYGSVAFTFFSGKGLRLLTPYLMLICLGCSIALNHQPFFQMLLIIQGVIYTIPCLTTFFPSLQRHKLVHWICYLIIGHVANLLGGLRYLLKHKNNRWAKLNHERSSL